MAEFRLSTAHCSAIFYVLPLRSIFEFCVQPRINKFFKPLLVPLYLNGVGLGYFVFIRKLKYIPKVRTHVNKGAERNSTFAAQHANVAGCQDQSNEHQLSLFIKLCKALV